MAGVLDTGRFLAGTVLRSPAGDHVTMGPEQKCTAVSVESCAGCIRIMSKLDVARSHRECRTRYAYSEELSLVDEEDYLEDNGEDQQLLATVSDTKKRRDEGDKERTGGGKIQRQA